MGRPSSAVEGAKALLAKDTALDDFGSYDPSDHLDVLRDDDLFAKEEEAYFQDQNHKLKLGRTVDRAVRLHIPGRLNLCLPTRAAGPLDGPSFSTFGQALHMVADFWAHSNYVELLLWSLSRKGALSSDFITMFNSFYEYPPAPGSPIQCVCPLPPAGKAREMTGRNTMFCYRADPQATPLVSTVFATADTAQSLLRRYVHHLLALEAELPAGEYKKGLDEQLDLVMSLFGFSQTPVLGDVRTLYIEFKSWLRDVGQRVRRFLAGKLEQIAQGASADNAQRLGLAAKIVRGVSSSEARDWARAGEYRYVAYGSSASSPRAE